MRLPWQKAETELEREIRYHLESLAAEYELQGRSRKEAEQQARKVFGGVESVKEECRDLRWWRWAADGVQDLRYGWRMIRKTPSISVAAVVSLALGIGATSAILTLAHTLLWSDLGVKAPQQLDEVLWISQDHAGGMVRSTSGSMYQDGALRVADFFSRAAIGAMQQRTAGKAQIAGHIGGELVSSSVNGKVSVVRLRGVTGNFFAVVGARQAAGRLLQQADDTPSSVPVLVVTHRFADRTWGSDSAAVGRTLRVNNTTYEVVGALAAEFGGLIPGDTTELYVPLEQTPALRQPDSFARQHGDSPTTWWIQVLARRAPATTQVELQRLLDTAFASSWTVPPTKAEATPHIRVQSAARGLGSIRHDLGNPMWMLLGLVALVLVVDCANIANLLLARAARRQKEVALRLSLGCSRGRLIRQFLTESLLLASIGAALSLPVAIAAGQLMTTLLGSQGAGMTLSMQPHLSTFLITGAIAIATAVLFGLYPAFRASQVQTVPALKEGSGSAGTSSRQLWAPAKMLVFGQTTLGVLLVASAILFTGKLMALVNQDTGFNRDHVLLFDVRPGEVGHEGEALRNFYFNAEQRLRDLPGVEAVGLAQTRPMRGGGSWTGVKGPGQARPSQTAEHRSNAGFLDSMSIPLAAGRAITPQEARGGLKVAVLSEDLARDMGLSPALGAHVTVEGGETYQVVGIARAARYHSMSETAPVLYLPFDYNSSSATFVVRTSIPPSDAFFAIQQVFQGLSQDLPLVDVYTMEQQISRTLQKERLFAWLCGSFGVLALVLCAVGLYGLMSNITERRTAEVGIRMALGASRQAVMKQVIGEGMLLVAGGVVVGLPAAWVVARFAIAEGFLAKEVAYSEPIALAAGVLLAASALAVLAPSVRAASVDPMRALREG